MPRIRYGLVRYGRSSTGRRRVRGVRRTGQSESDRARGDHAGEPDRGGSGVHPPLPLLALGDRTCDFS
jgi:hypothetical protein